MEVVDDLEISFDEGIELRELDLAVEGVVHDGEDVSGIGFVGAAESGGPILDGLEAEDDVVVTTNLDGIVFGAEEVAASVSKSFVLVSLDVGEDLLDEFLVTGDTSGEESVFAFGKLDNEEERVEFGGRSGLVVGDDFNDSFKEIVVISFVLGSDVGEDERGVGPVVVSVGDTGCEMNICV